MSTGLTTKAWPDGLILRDDRGTENLPEHLKSAGQLGTETMGEHITPPRLKVLQPLRDEQYKMFKEGEVILAPQNIKIATVDEPFWFVPLLFYPEWIAVNPIQLKGQKPFIRERTLDPLSQLAMKCRDPERREEPCPEQTGTVIRNKEFLTFVVVLLNQGGLTGMPVTMAFSSGEHRQGSSLATLIKMRSAPICGCIFEAKVPNAMRRNAKGAWYGLDISNPQSLGCPPAFVMNKAEFEVLQKLHMTLKEQLEAKLLQADYGEGDEDTGSTAEAAAAAKGM